MPRTSPYRVALSVAERRLLDARARKYTSPYRDVIRAKIVLLAAAGVANDAIAARLDTPRQIVSKWRKRFCLWRLPGLAEQPRGGRPARGPASSSPCRRWRVGLPHRCGVPLSRWSRTALRQAVLAQGLVAEIIE